MHGAISMSLKQENLIETINKLAQEIIDNEEQNFLWDKEFEWKELFQCSLVDIRDALKIYDENNLAKADKEIINEYRLYDDVDLLFMSEIATNEAIKELVTHRVYDLQEKLTY